MVCDIIWKQLEKLDRKFEQGKKSFELKLIFD